MGWFSHTITHHPGKILYITGFICFIAFYYSATGKRFPSFEDPQLGFETRGTEISQRLTAWGKLVDESRPSGFLVINPNDFLYEHMESTQKDLELHNSEEDAEEDESCKHKKKVPGSGIWNEIQKISFPRKNNAPMSEEQINRLYRLSYDTKFFCDSPHTDYSHLILSTNGIDLMSYEALMQICDLQFKITSLPQYMRLCLTSTTDICCNMWSLPNYIAWLQKVPSCKQITRKYINDTVDLLDRCVPFYHQQKLAPNSDRDPSVPRECYKDDVIFNLMHFILDVDLLPSGQMKMGELQNTALFLPIAKSSSTVELYHELENASIDLNLFNIAAMELGSKYSLFDEYLLRDTRLLLFSCVCIVVCMWFYTGCAFITILTIISIFLSFVLAYYIYTFILQLQFFPFMNILAVIVALGIGSDDAYIMCKVWDRTKIENPHITKVELVHMVMKHSAIAVFVTTLTTVAAFLSSFASSVTAVRCFSVFAGLSVFVNFVFMITWVLPGIVISADWPYVPLLHWSFKKPENIYENILIVKSSFDNYMASIICKYHKYLLIGLGGLSLLSMVSVIFWPRLQVPDSTEFQLFDKNHPFEQYDLMYKYKFWFNRVFVGEISEEKLPLRFVWGVLPIDTGNYLEPLSRGKLHFDPSFDVASNASQEWLLKFCRKLRMQPFYYNTPGLLLSNCFIETFKQWMEQKCIDPIDGTKNYPCCEATPFPYPRRVFNTCIVKAMARLYKTPRDYFISDVAGPRFLKKPANPKAPKMKALVVEFDSTMSYTTSFEAMNTFHQQVDAWTKEEFSKAPEGMKNGWYVTHLAFYDLQRTLCQDTGTSIFISMSIALLVLFLVTFNIPLSLYAILTITCIIFGSISILIMLGWKLNVLESIAISVAIGMSVDFSLHYAVNYKLCPDKRSKKVAVIHSLSMMVSPSLMAAITTGASGLFMLPSVILPYIQIGIFLIVVSAVSWIYSTFFLMSLLYMIGPENNFGQFSFPSLKLESIRNMFKKNGNGKSLFSCFRFRPETVYSIQEMENLNQIPNTEERMRSKSFSQTTPIRIIPTSRRISFGTEQILSGASSVTFIQDEGEQRSHSNTYVNC